jgi:hypothetical protein
VAPSCPNGTGAEAALSSTLEDTGGIEACFSLGDGGEGDREDRERDDDGGEGDREGDRDGGEGDACEATRRGAGGEGCLREVVSGIGGREEAGSPSSSSSSSSSSRCEELPSIACTCGLERAIGPDSWISYRPTWMNQLLPFIRTCIDLN